MSRLPSYTAADVVRKLRRAGFVFDRPAKGSHEIWYHPLTKRRVVVVNHPGRDMARGTLRSLIQDTGLTIEEFVKL